MEPTSTELNRAISLPLITLYGIGGIIGAGIYVLVGKIIAVSGVLAPFAFVFAAVVALFSALSYAELSSRFPKSGGEVVYIQQGFSRRWLSTIVGFGIVFGGIVSSATISKGAVAYLQVFVDASSGLLLVLFCVLIGAIAAWGVMQSVGLAALITVIEIGGIVMVCMVGAPNLAALPTISESLLPSASWADWSAILSAALLAFYAYIGFEDMVNMSEEVKDPRRVLPIAILLALVLSTLLYIVVVLVFISSMPLETLATSDAIFTDMIEQNSDIPPAVIGLISLFAITNGAMVQVIMSSRVLYGMSRDNLAPPFLAQVNKVTRTPVKATLLVVFCVWTFASILPIERLAQVTSYILLAVFSLVNLALIRIKLIQTDEAAAFNVPLAVPMIGLILCVAFVSVQLLS